MRILRFLNTPVHNFMPSMKSLPFREKQMANLFSRNKIWVCTDFTSRMENLPLIGPMLKSLGISTYPEAEQLVTSLTKLGIRKIHLEPSVVLDKKFIEHGILMSILNKYIDETKQIEKMVIKRSGPDPYRIDGTSLIIAQTFAAEVIELRHYLMPITMIEKSAEWMVSSESQDNERNFMFRKNNIGAAISQVSEILTLVPYPGSTVPLLDPKYLHEYAEVKIMLTGRILEALLEFKHIYLNHTKPEETLGQNEIRSLLTYHIGYMLSQLINPKTKEPFLKPELFRAMPYSRQIQTSFGNSSYTFGALVKFLDVFWPQKVKELTRYNILDDYRVYQMVKKCFERQVNK